MKNLFLAGALGACLVAGPASAQCLLEYTANLGNPIGAEAITTAIKTSGTFECGVLRGTTCASGTLTGTCAASESTSAVVSCNGACTASYGGTAAAVACVDGPSDEVSRTTVATTCYSGVCTSQGSTDDGASTVYSLVVTDPTETPGDVEKCLPGGGGLTQTRATGVVAVIPPF